MRKEKGMNKSNVEQVKINDPSNSLKVMRIIRNFNSNVQVKATHRDAAPTPAKPTKK